MKTIKIGRSQDNDYVISNPNVSGHHAVLIVDPDHLHAVVKDLNSTNGTYVNDRSKRITSEIRVSRADVIFFAGERATLAEILAAASERRDNQRSYSPPSGSMSKTIGKSSDNDIVLPNDDVSRRHAVIHKTPSGDVVIEDLNSTNGTFVNGQRVNVKSLTPGDSVSITRNYPLQWETLFSASAPAPIQSKPNRSWQKLAAVIVGVLLVAAAAFLLIPRSISKEELYKQYHSAVCWVYVKCGYQIMLDDDNITPTICRVLRVTPSKYVTVDESEGVIKPGIAEYEGTAFFISNDGKLATNLHITRPWLFDSTIEILEATANEIVAANVQYDPSLSRRKLKIVPEILYLAIRATASNFGRE